MSAMTNRLLIERARAQRQGMADSERRLWQMLRASRFQGHKFRRQVPVGPFIADFACKARRLIIEADGDVHGDDAQQARDATRTRWLEDRGWRVLRFWTSQQSTLDDVSAEIFEALEGAGGEVPDAFPSP